MTDQTYELIDICYRDLDNPDTVRTIQVAAVICGCIGIHHPDEVTGKPETADCWILTHAPTGRSAIPRINEQFTMIAPDATLEEVQALAWAYHEILKDYPTLPADSREQLQELFAMWKDHYARKEFISEA